MTEGGTTIDTRGLSCPQPVILTKNALNQENEGVFKVLTDSPVARDNVGKYAESQGFTVDIVEQDGEYILELSKK